MPRDKSVFRFKKFSVKHENSTMKVGTDSVLLGSWVAKDFSPTHIIDVGTGSGLLALMMAQRFPNANIVGLDIHAPSIEDFQWNIDQFPLPHQLNAQQKDFLEYHPIQKVDFIISNPPYFSESLLSDKQDKNRVRHQVHLNMEQMFLHSAKILMRGGVMAIILPTKEMQDTIEIAQSLEFYPKRIAYISSAQDMPVIRMMAEFTFQQKEILQEEEIFIYEKDRSYTQQYKSLTKDFYLHF